MSPLERIGEVAVPLAVLEHFHVKEAAALVSVVQDNRERIIGTDNKSEPHAQVYGWGRNVEKHIDDTGWVYIAPLSLKRSILMARRSAKEQCREFLRVGHVYRLDDRAAHWTRDSGNAVCLLAGVFKEPTDTAAMAMLERGMAQLASGDKDAPRVAKAFRVPKGVECYAVDYQGAVVLVEVDEALRRRWLIAECSRSGCQSFAYQVDTMFPYHSEANLCRTHFREKRA